VLAFGAWEMGYYRPGAEPSIGDFYGRKNQDQVRNKQGFEI